ncbi:hypothetical protein CYY_009634 [Polysphondylium violaceum]|uniref:RNA-binding region RNP-1 domain-containing protein n=1 Tax=Polysphondylium violaceum TaxID=133409 RepID=A0A8J4V0C7_9MYCE|nr:hypothetical protein CYY_009634 [Polysphondylium violaceum]
MTDSNHDSIEAMEIDTPVLGASAGTNHHHHAHHTLHHHHIQQTNATAYYPTTATQPPPPPPPPASYDPYYHYYFTSNTAASAAAASASSVIASALQQSAAEQSKTVLKDYLKLWVGNIPDNTTEQDLKDVFGVYGTIESVKLSDHCSFIQFTDAQQAATAQKAMNGEMFKGNRIKVNWASIKNKSHLSSVSGYMPGVQPPLADPHFASVPTPLSGGSASIQSPPPPPPSQLPPPPPSSSSSLPSQHYSPPPPTVSTYDTTTITTLPNGSMLVSDSDPYVNRKLFLGVAVVHEQLKDLRVLFSKYGDIDDLLVSQKGNAFLKYYKVESAVLAKREMGWKYKIQYDKREGPQPPFHSAVPYSYPSSSSSTSLPSSSVASTSYTNNTNNKFNEPLSIEESHQIGVMLETLRPTKSLIKEAKDWILLHLKSGKPIIQLIVRILNNNINNNRVSLLYLVNDILYFGSSKRKYGETTDTLSNLFEPFLISIINTFAKESVSNQTIVLNVLNIWDNKQYYNYNIINSLKSLL